MILPPEWASHHATWLAWPHLIESWGENLEIVQNEWIDFAKCVAEFEKIKLLVPQDLKIQEKIKEKLDGLSVEYFDLPYGDIWLRDTGPIFCWNESGQVEAAIFQFNGWGNKYLFDNDSTVSEKIAHRSGKQTNRFSWILEGGSIEVDGEGTLLTTRQCNLNPNRNSGVSETQFEKLMETLGIKKVLWIDQGLENDHTDGHIDTLVRFVAPGKVLCMEPSGPDDPNEKILRKIKRDLETMKDASNRDLEVFSVPSPGRITDSVEGILAASYMNFIYTDQTVVVPFYGVDQDEDVRRAIQELIPNRQVMGKSARRLITGGGAFHCISQQEPAERPYGK